MAIRRSKGRTERKLKVDRETARAAKSLRAARSAAARALVASRKMSGESRAAKKRDAEYYKGLASMSRSTMKSRYSAMANSTHSLPKALLMYRRRGMKGGPVQVSGYSTRTGRRVKAHTRRR